MLLFLFVDGTSINDDDDLMSPRAGTFMVDDLASFFAGTAGAFDVDVTRGSLPPVNARARLGDDAGASLPDGAGVTITVTGAGNGNGDDDAILGVAIPLTPAYSIHATETG